MATNETTVGADLYSAVDQFFQLFPSYRSRNFYVTGESYAGKYVPACAYTIHERNKLNKDKINLKGIAIGDGAFDPAHQARQPSALPAHSLRGAAHTAGRATRRVFSSPTP
jgi:vitellogenic carboxypeptidase-like protein